ncbi:MAG TPA: AAA domain-containing protein [Candidatus Binatia bacterium]|nr:AAA domain-containing protein [Candidatus Binatia bacterium]
MPTPTAPDDPAELLAAFVAALRDEADAQRRSGGHPIDVRDGHLVDVAAEGATYRFTLHADVFLPDGAPVRLFVDGRSHDAEVVHRQGDTLLLFVEWPLDADPPPETIEQATLRAEPWFLTVALADRLTDVDSRPGPASAILARFTGGEVVMKTGTYDTAARTAPPAGNAPTDASPPDETTGGAVADRTAWWLEEDDPREVDRGEDTEPAVEARDSPWWLEADTAEPNGTTPSSTTDESDMAPSTVARTASDDLPWWLAAVEPEARGAEKTEGEPDAAADAAPAAGSLGPASPNRWQEAAIEACCQAPLHFVWGPPGTGKTRTLGALVARLAARGESVLVVAHANVAVDAAVLATASALGLDRPEILRGPGPLPGTDTGGTPTGGAEIGEAQPGGTQPGPEPPIVRAGPPALDAVRRLGIAAQDVALRRRPDLARRLRALTVELARLERSAAPAGEPDRHEPNRHELDRHQPDRLGRSDSHHRTDRQGRSAEIHRELKALRAELREEERAAVASARILFATLPKAAVDETIHRRSFDAVLVDEASMAVPPQVVFAASRARRRLAVFGDFRQLPPIVASPTPTTQFLLGRDAFDLAGIPAAIDAGREPADLSMLRVQYRMHPRIRRLVSDFAYLGRLEDGPRVAAETGPIAARPPFPGQPVVLLETEPIGARSWLDAHRTSRWSPMSAVWAARFAHELARGGSDVALLSPYRPQTAVLATLVRAMGLRESVTTGTIHRFQGAERAAVVLDLADARPLRPPGTLLRGATGARLLTVAASRARGKLVVLAARALLAAPGPAAALLGDLPPLPHAPEPWSLAASGTTIEWAPDVDAVADELARDALGALAAWLPADPPAAVARALRRVGGEGRTAPRGSAVVLADEVVWILGEGAGGAWAAARIVGRAVVRAVWLNLVGSPLRRR